MDADHRRHRSHSSGIALDPRGARKLRSRGRRRARQGGPRRREAVRDAVREHAAEEHARCDAAGRHRWTASRRSMYTGMLDQQLAQAMSAARHRPRRRDGEAALAKAAAAPAALAAGVTAPALDPAAPRRAAQPAGAAAGRAGRRSDAVAPPVGATGKAQSDSSTRCGRTRSTPRKRPACRRTSSSARPRSNRAGAAREIKARRRRDLPQPVRHQGRALVERRDRRDQDHRIRQRRQSRRSWTSSARTASYAEVVHGLREPAEEQSALLAQVLEAGNDPAGVRARPAESGLRDRPGVREQAHSASSPAASCDRDLSA